MQALTIAIGDTFTDWRVLVVTSRTDKNRIVLCQCRCLTIDEVLVRSLIHRRSRRCRQCTQRYFKHGHTIGGKQSLTWESWQSMLERCYQPKTHGYPRYGGRGITVCERWRTSFETFLADMGERPSRQHTLDRKDGTKLYEPNNCRWASKSEQGRNKMTNRLLTLNDVTQTMAAWAAQTGIPMDTIWHRLDEGWTHERALTQPVRPHHRRPRPSRAESR